MKIKLCPHCKKPVTKSENPEYSWECNYCDEDFYDFECDEIDEIIETNITDAKTINERINED